MRTLHSHRTVLLLVFALLLSALLFNAGTWQGTAQDVSESLLPLRPEPRERVVAQSFVHELERRHISQRVLDRELSKEAFRLYIKALDPRKLFFYQSDIDEFRANYELRFSETIKQSPVDVRPAFEIYNRYLARLEERVGMVHQILDVPMDFTLDEEHIFDKRTDFTLDDNIIRQRGLQTFPATTEEAYERWRKRLKSELLALKAEADTGQQKRERDIAEGKEPEEVDDRDPVERLRLRYTSLQRRMLFEGRIDNDEIRASVRQQANDDVMELFLNSVAGALDPHSSYMSPSTVRAFQDGMIKNFKGIGATLSSEDGYIVIREVITGSPADRAELKRNDKIQGVGQGRDGKIEEVIDFKVTDVVKLIRGDEGTVVRLDILPGGKGPSKIVEIVREEIPLEDRAARSEIFDTGTKPDGTPYRIGFIQLPDFYFDMEAGRRGDPEARSATADVKKKLQGFVEAGVDAVILDLRNNGGGVLAEAIGITGLFLGPGTVVQVKDERSTRPQPRGNTAESTSTEWTGPLVVVTNKFSASASEILSGAIKDHRRGLLIGDSTSHGKGTVQSVVDLNERLFSGTDLGMGKITIQGYYRPSGVSPQGGGVEVDVVLPSLSDAMEDVMEFDLDNALTLQRVAAAPGFTPRQYVTPQIITELKRRSSQRVAECEEFAKQLDRIAAYRESRARRATPLNEEKFMEEIRRFNTDEWEREELEEMINKDKTIKRDFYIEEMLSLTVDYVKIMEELGITFPRERTVPQQQQRRSLFGLGF